MVVNRTILSRFKVYRASDLEFRGLLFVLTLQPFYFQIAYRDMKEHS